MAKTFDCDRGFISKLLQTKDLATVKDAQITISFLSGESKLAYRFISDTVKKTGEVPTVRAFKKKFPSYELETVYDEEKNEEVVGTEENLLYWCQELRAKKKHNAIADATEDVLQFLEDYKGDEAFDRIKKVVAHIETDIEENHDVDITDTEGRVKAYKKRKKNQGMTGIATGIEHLDYILRGLNKQTLTTLIANTGVGKTWIEVLIGAYVMLNGGHVIHFVTEMSDEQMRDRYEAMLYSMTYGNFNYSKFTHGKLDFKTEKKYYKFLREVMPTLESLQIVTATSPLGVAASIEKYGGADLILIDGVYLMEDDQKADSDWLRVAHITRDLKKMAKTMNIPIFINSQADKNTSKKNGPNLSNISYSQAIGMDSDNVIAMYRDETMIADREACLAVLKQREGERGRVMLNWDFDTMNFKGIYAEREGGEDNEDTYDEDGEVVGKNTLGEVDE